MIWVDFVSVRLRQRARRSTVSGRTAALYHLGPPVMSSVIPTLISLPTSSFYMGLPQIITETLDALCNFSVTMQAQKEAPPDMQCKDKFLVQSVIVAEGTLVKDITGDMVSVVISVKFFPADVCFRNAWGCTLCSLPKNQVMWWMRLSWRLSTSHHPNRHPQCVRDLKKARHPELQCLMEVTWIIKRYGLQMLFACFISLFVHK